MKIFLLSFSLMVIWIESVRASEDYELLLRKKISEIGVSVTTTKLNAVNMWKHEFLGKEGLSFSLLSKHKLMEGVLSFSPEMEFVMVNFDRSGEVEIYPVSDFLRRLVRGKCESVVCYSKLETRFNSKGDYLGTVRRASLMSMQWKDEMTIFLQLFEIPEEDGIGPYGITVNFRTGEALGTRNGLNPAGFLILNNANIPIKYSNSMGSTKIDKREVREVKSPSHREGK